MDVELYQPESKPRTPVPADLLQLALSKGAGIDQLEKLLALQERYEATEARKAYVVAMAAFKATPPKISKDRHVSFKTSSGKTEYDHASLANVTGMVNSSLSVHGLSAGWKTNQEDGKISVTCCITHIMGHQECTTLSSGADSSGGKNAIQAIGSAVSYLQRYTLLALTGLATHDQDTDGIPPAEPEEKISVAQINELSRACEEKGYDADEKLKGLAEKVYKIESISELPGSKFDDAMKRISKLPVKERVPGEEG
jgi:hypothetical protein